MITIEKLDAFGADTKEGLSRCMGMDSLYLKLVGIVSKEPKFDELKAAIEARDLDKAFEAAHALKGVLGNLGLVPMFEAASELTELLRPIQPCDYSSALQKVQNGLKQLKDLIGGQES